MAMESESAPSSTVLVVDDEESVLAVFEKLLPRRGLKVKVAISGEAALVALASTSFGCLLVDKNLPGIDGFSVMREARKLQPYCAAVMMTGYSSAASAVEAMRLGAVDYLEKPFENLDLVVQKIERAIRLRRTELERDTFLERIRSFEGELSKQTEQARQQHTEIEMFNKLLEVRVRQATEDLEEKCQILEGCISSSRDADYALQVHCESILEFVRQVQLEDKDPIAIARAAITRIERRLEGHLGLIRHTVQREGEPQKAAAPERAASSDKGR